MNFDVMKLVQILGFIQHAEQTLKNGGDKKAKVKGLIADGKGVVGALDPAKGAKLDQFIDLAVDLAKTEGA